MKEEQPKNNLKIRNLFYIFAIGVSIGAVSAMVYSSKILYKEMTKIEEIKYEIAPDTNCQKEEEKKVEYEIVEAPSNRNYTKRGYYIDTLNQPDAPYWYIIAMGEKSTGGYSIKVTEVTEKEEVVTIIVDETSPGPNETVTQAFTYPTVTVKFDKNPKNVIIKNLEGDIFDFINE